MSETTRDLLLLALAWLLCALVFAGFWFRMRRVRNASPLDPARSHPDLEQPRAHRDDAAWRDLLVRLRETD